MSYQTHLQNLITNHTRRLQKLKEQQALTGFNTDPGILLEIEDIEAELRASQMELAAFEDQSEQQTQPRVAQDADSSDENQTDLQHIEAKLKELQTKLAVLEDRSKHEPHLEADQAGTSPTEVHIQLPPLGLKNFGSPQTVLLQHLYRRE